MTGNPWDKPAVVPAPPTCAVCGEAVGRQPVIVAPPHTYHRDCYAAFHAAMNDRANLDKTIAEIRAVVAMNDKAIVREITEGGAP